MSVDVDEVLRAELNAGRSRRSGDALRVLYTLQPSMRRARRRRHVALGAVTTLLLGVGGAGVVAVHASSQTPMLRTSTGDSPPVDSASREVDALRPATTEDPSATIEQRVASSTVTTNRSDEDSVAPAPAPRRTEDGTPADSSVRPGVEASAPFTSGHPPPVAATPSPPTQPAHATTPEVEPSTTPPPVIDQPDQTVPGTELDRSPALDPTPDPTPDPTRAAPEPTSSHTASGETSIPSACGAVVVWVHGVGVDFMRAEPLDGFRVDVKKRGPDQVEVGLADHHDECQVKVRVEDGQLRIRVDDNRSDGH